MRTKYPMLPETSVQDSKRSHPQKAFKNIDCGIHVGTELVQGAMTALKQVWRHMYISTWKSSFLCQGWIKTFYPQRGYLFACSSLSLIEK
jgi:hypothetical protein